MEDNLLIKCVDKHNEGYQGDYYSPNFDVPEGVILCSPECQSSMAFTYSPYKNYK